MEEGSLRCDLNVSIAPIVDTNDTVSAATTTTTTEQSDNPFASFLPVGTGNRVEVKNLNSIRQGTYSLL